MIDMSDLTGAFQNIQRMIESGGEVYAIILLTMGAMQCFFGYKMMRFMIALSGFLVGGVASAALGMANQLQSMSMPDEGTIMLYGLVGGIVCAILANVLYLLGIFLLCGMGGFLLGLAMTETVGVAIGCGLFLGILGVVLTKPIIIISTACSGGRLCALGTAVLMDSFENTLIFTIIFAVLGMVCQFQMESRVNKNQAPVVYQTGQPVGQAVGQAVGQPTGQVVAQGAVQAMAQAPQAGVVAQPPEQMLALFPETAEFGFADFFQDASDGMDRAYKAMVSKDPAKTRLYLDHALTANPQDSHGHFMKFMCNHRIYQEEDLKKLRQPLNQFSEFREAMSHANKEQLVLMTEYNKIVIAAREAEQQRLQAIALAKQQKKDAQKEAAKETMRQGADSAKRGATAMGQFLFRHKKKIAIATVVLLLLTGAGATALYFIGQPPDEERVTKDIYASLSPDFGEIVSFEYAGGGFEGEYSVHTANVEAKTDTEYHYHLFVVHYAKEFIRYELRSEREDGGVNPGLYRTYPLLFVSESQVEAYLDTIIPLVDGYELPEPYEINYRDFSISGDLKSGLSTVQVEAEYQMEHYKAKVEQEIKFRYRVAEANWVCDDKLYAKVVPNEAMDAATYERILVASQQMLRYNNQNIVEISAETLVSQENIQINLQSNGQDYLVSSQTVVDNGICDIKGNLLTELTFDKNQGYSIQSMDFQVESYDYSAINGRSYQGAYNMVDTENMGVPIVGEVRLNNINILTGNLIELEATVADYTMNFQGSIDPLTGKVSTLVGDSSFMVDVPNFYMDILETSSQEATITLELDNLSKSTGELQGTVNFVGHVKGIALFAGNPSYPAVMSLTVVS